MRAASQMQSAFHDIGDIGGLPHEEFVLPWSDGRSARGRVHSAQGLRSSFSLPVSAGDIETIVTALQRSRTCSQSLAHSRTWKRALCSDSIRLRTAPPRHQSPRGKEPGIVVPRSPAEAGKGNRMSSKYTALLPAAAFVACSLSAGPARAQEGLEEILAAPIQSTAGKAAGTADSAPALSLSVSAEDPEPLWDPDTRRSLQLPHDGPRSRRTLWATPKSARAASS